MGDYKTKPATNLKWRKAGLFLLALGFSAPLFGKTFMSMEEASVYPSFPVQGEYAGTITLPGAEPVHVGLQVAAYGENEFRARLFFGGFPGDLTVPSDGGEAYQLQGAFEDYVLEFGGEGTLRLRYGLNGFTALDEGNQDRGRLKRVYRKSPTLGMAPPSEALVLVDGTGLEHWRGNASMTDDRLLKQGAITAGVYGDIRLHLEAKLAFMPEKRNQSRSNSGIYIQNRYEVQILDSFALAPVFNGNTSLYRVAAPLVNATYPPLTWQSYDVFFRAPRFDAAGEKTENARVTVYLNGALVQDDVELENGTGLGGQRQEVPRGELLLQNHGGDPIRFRNVWLVEDEYSPPGTRFIDAQGGVGKASASTTATPVFGDDLAFLKTHTDAVVLRLGDAAIAVVPEYQGRVMTATASGDDGLSSGWINYELVEQGILPEGEATGLDAHLYAFGGEERIWFGPEGGQYSIFFEPGVPFEFENWFTPAAIDTDPWKVVDQSDHSMTLTHSFSLMNYSRTRFDLSVKREVKLLPDSAIEAILGTALPESAARVAYETVNTVTNEGDQAWTPEGGLLSIWLLSMFQPSDKTIMFIPYVEGDESDLGPVVNDDYFGSIESSRLQAKEGMILFSGDGKSRGKIGVLPGRSKGIAGSYDPVAGRLTLLSYDPPADERRYVNSQWQLQDDPYSGDAINAYNDGPVGEDGEPMGPFYELESSSPALALAPGESAIHVQRILHIYADEVALDRIFRELTGKPLTAVNLKRE